MINRYIRLIAGTLVIMAFSAPILVKEWRYG